TGVFTGGFAINPVNQKKVPIWIADYVLADYGTGAIMAVPAHDQRDYDFAKKYNLPILQVVQALNSATHDPHSAFEEEGFMINSGEFNGLQSSEGKKKVTEWLEK